MSDEQHSPMAQAFLRVVHDMVRRIPPRQRPLMAVVIRAGERPRLTSRDALARHLASNDIEMPRVRVQSHQVLTWIESDECSGALVVPVSRAPDGNMFCDLPTDAVIASLIGDPMPTESIEPCPTCSAPETTAEHRERCADAAKSVEGREVDRVLGPLDDIEEAT